MTGYAKNAFRSLHEAAVALGATEQEIGETLEVGVLMGRGPAVTCSGKALEFLRSLAPS